MTPIPILTRKRLGLDPLMKACLQCGKEPEWHHVITGMGRKQIQEWWAIAPLCTEHHRGKGATKEVLEYSKWWCLIRGKSELKKYPKHNLEQELKYLTRKFTKFNTL